MEEIWKTIEEFPNYEVSNMGNVRNKKTKRVLKHNIDTHGYYKVVLRKDGKNFTINNHRLVAVTFIPNPDNLPQVNHKDEIKLHNSVDNLEWCTAEYNIRYSIEKMRKSHFYKRRIISQYSINGEYINSFISARKAMRCTGIDYSNICKCCRGETKKAGGYIWKYE